MAVWLLLRTGGNKYNHTYAQSRAVFHSVFRIHKYRIYVSKLSMRPVSILTMSFLVVTVLSYGMAPAFAQSDEKPSSRPELQILPTADFGLEVQDGRTLYANGQSVTVTGQIDGYADQTIKQAVAARVMHLTEATDTKDAILSLVWFGQVVPNADGTFTISFKAGGPLWKQNGDYHVAAYYGGTNRDIVTIEFTGAGSNLFDDKSDAPPKDVAPVDKTPDVPPPPDKKDDPPPPPPPPDKKDDPPPPPPPPDKKDDPPPPPPPADPICGTGTQLVNGTCEVIPPPSGNDNGGGGCLIATAAFGSELAPQVQMLRELRENTLLSTAYGTSFMTGFNQMYYVFSPAIADLERENPVFRDAVRASITPMISTLSIMTLADPGSEEQVLGLGISVIALNLVMYVAAPALIVFGAYRYVSSRRQKL